MSGLLQEGVALTNAPCVQAPPAPRPARRDAHAAAGTSVPAHARRPLASHSRRRAAAGTPWRTVQGAAALLEAFAAWLAGVWGGRAFGREAAPLAEAQAASWAAAASQPLLARSPRSAVRCRRNGARAHVPGVVNARNVLLNELTSLRHPWPHATDARMVSVTTLRPFPQVTATRLVCDGPPELVDQRRIRGVWI